MSRDLEAQLRALLGESPVSEYRVEDVTRIYRQKALPRYRKNRGRNISLGGLLDLIDDLFCDQPASSFGPKKLAKLRDELLAEGNSRKYINERIRYTIKIFNYALSQEMIEPDQIVALRSLEALKYGEAPEPPPREVVTLEAIQCVLPELHPVIQSMLRIQVATGARPKEVFSIKPKDIDRSREVWWYRPGSHKTQHQGKAKTIPILGDARAALEPYLLKAESEDDLCFKTQRGNQWQAGPYRNQIHKACDRLGVARWSPYTIRHLAASIVRERLGLEGAKSLLGHSSSKITEQHYAARTEREALAAAQAAPTLIAV